MAVYISISLEHQVEIFLLLFNHLMLLLFHDLHLKNVIANTHNDKKCLLNQPTLTNAAEATRVESKWGICK